MKTILQHDERDCGAACLAMIAKHYGYSESLNVFRNITNTDRDGSTVFDIMKAANGIGFSTDALNGNILELKESLVKKEIRLPLIAHINTADDYYHFVVLSGLSDNKVQVLDPAKGKYTMTLDTFSNCWTGNIITLTPSESFQKQKKASGSLIGFFPLLKGQLKSFTAIILMSIIISAIGILGAFAFQIIIDHSTEIVEESVEGNEHHHEHDIEFMTNSIFLNNVLERLAHSVGHLEAKDISLIFVWLIGLYALAMIIQYIRARLIIAMSKKIDLRLILPYFNHLMDIPLQTVLKRKTGDYISRYTDAATIRNALSTTAITMIIDAVLATGCGIILLYQSPRLAIIAWLVLLVYALIVMINRKKIQGANREFMENNAHIHSFLKEHIDGVESIKSLNAEKNVKDSMNLKFQEFLTAAVKRSRIVMGQDTIISGVETIGITLILWQGFLQVVQGNLTLGTLITFYVLLGYLITPVKNLVEVFPTIQSAGVAADRLRDILDSPVENTEGEDLSASKSIEKWNVSDLAFGYGKNDSMLKEIQFSFRKGDKVALVGKSGSGKTTLAKLFAGLYEPKTGEISINGVPISHFTKESVRNAFLYVGGDSSLFSGTILDNLRMGSGDCSEKEIQRIAEVTGISELIDSLPDGLMFHLEEGGINLSKGQRQRIVMLRALLKHPRLLILDEATSNLDSKTEQKLLESLKILDKDLTILMVTHNLQTVKDFNKIIVLEEGRIAGSGTHSELATICPEYYGLYKERIGMQ